MFCAFVSCRVISLWSHKQYCLQSSLPAEDFVPAEALVSVSGTDPFVLKRDYHETDQVHFRRKTDANQLV